MGKQSGTRIGELKELTQICESLVIQQLQNVVDAEDASEADLTGKQYLNELQLGWSWKWDVEKNGDMVLSDLKPHSNLKRLTIFGYGGSRFPGWFEGPSILINMVSLRPYYCNNV